MSSYLPAAVTKPLGWGSDLILKVQFDYTLVICALEMVSKVTGAAMSACFPTLVSLV